MKIAKNRWAWPSARLRTSFAVVTRGEQTLAEQQALTSKGECNNESD